MRSLVIRTVPSVVFPCRPLLERNSIRLWPFGMFRLVWTWLMSMLLVFVVLWGAGMLVSWMLGVLVSRVMVLLGATGCLNLVRMVRSRLENIGMWM